MSKTIFFDWGGVIADDPGDDFLRKLLVQIGATEDQYNEIYETYMRKFMRGEISEAEYWQLLRDNYGLDVHPQISEEFKKWRGLEVNNEILALVDELRAKGHKVALLSNIIEPTYNVLAATEYFGRFDAVIASCKVGYAKPQEEIYDIALQNLGAKTEDSIFIDDKERNLVPAREMGFTTILAENPQQILRDIRAAAL